MKVLTKRQILLLHSALIQQSGGADGIRDEGLLDSAVNTPFQTFADQELYPSLLEKAARLGFGLICNHPFIDGNKRIGTHAMLVFLDINQMTLSYEDDDLIETILRVASGTLDYNGLLDWLQEHLESSASLPLASCWPRPQQLLPVSATGGGRRRCPQRGSPWQAGQLSAGR